MNQPTQLRYHGDAINLKELMQSIQNLFGLLQKNILILIILGLLGGAAGFYIAFSQKQKYIAESNFIIKESGTSTIAGSLGNLSAILGGPGVSSLDRAIAVISSEKVINKVLFSTLTIGGSTDLALNHFIKLEGVTKKWEKDTSFFKVNFTTIDTAISLFSYEQRKAYKVILSSFKEIVQKSYEKKSGILTLTVTLSNEDLAIGINLLIIRELKNFFLEQATENSNLNVELLTKKVDSIQSELNRVRNQLARNTDQSLGVLLNIDKVDLKSLATKEQILLAMYSEAQKNLETFLFLGQTASNSTVVNLLDVPFSPLTPISKSKVRYSIAGFILAFLFSFGLILVRRWYRNLITS